MTFLGALGGYFFKRASSHSLGFNKGFLLNLCLGGIFYVLGALFNIVLLKYLPYTIVYPLSSITYLWTMVLSYFLLSEKFTVKKISGVCLIGLGSFLLAV
ncbi:EamA family transporter [Neobacillus drentensis]|uniref:EamA family transporter n=1 Tax=Neobacillus drentensis TaxID=220684 RepID=UPI002FFF36A5